MVRAVIIWTIALCLAASISVAYISAAQNEMHAATGSFNVSGTSTPTPTPTPTPSPAPTATPTPTSAPTTTPTPEPSPTASPSPTAEPSPTATPTAESTPTPTATSSGSSSQPSISLQLLINIMGKTTTGLRTITGKMLGDITADSEDGKITMTIYKDTYVYNAFGEPLSVINISTIDPTLKAPPLSLPDEHYFVYVYEFSPHGTGFSAPIEIGVNYYQSDLPKSPEELTLQIYRMNGAHDEWEAMPSLWDAETSSVICSTSHLSTYALIAAPLQEAEPAESPTPAPPSEERDNWIYLVLILPTTLFISFIYIMITRSRKEDLTTEKDSHP